MSVLAAVIGVPLVMALGLFVILRFGKEEGDREAPRCRRSDG